ncbi:PREDICTED: cuticle protein 8 [Wasmannia auropunctata]|uniref:cuticle protein 8 n=1 Tax=Wasmannia auropunctata TaxID=64793 RepID=UPI0005EEB8A8|nr:PREDICTED: cuticle protein 8 [Wasmannia auropunctata]
MRPPVLLFLLFCLGLAVAQHNQPYPTPVPILKQINKHNEDGSYSYGFEAADGSYKIESKYPNGEIYGKYGFVDDTGTVREVEYGASKERGFEPVGPGINVPPPTLTGNSITGNANEPEDDGQYREDPSIYHTDPRFTNGERWEVPAKYRTQPIAYNPPQQIQQIAPAAYNQPKYKAPKGQSVKYRPAAVGPRFQTEYRPQYRSTYDTQYQGQQLQPVYPSSAISAGPQGHIATNIDVNAGLASYTVDYKR